jgi:hypothetical protein
MVFSKIMTLKIGYMTQGSHYFQIRRRSDFSFRELTWRSGRQQRKVVRVLGGLYMMKSIKTNPNSSKGPNKGKIVNKLYCILLTTLELI